MPYKDLQKRKEFACKYAREWRRRNKEKVNARVKEDRVNNPEKYRAYDRKYRANNLKDYRLKDVLSKRKINEAQYENLFITHNSKCGICLKKETMRGRSGETMPLSVDHCHKCEMHIRGLLCHDCNTALGKAKDDILIIQSAILYLKKYLQSV